MNVLALPMTRSPRADLELHVHLWAVVVVLVLLAGFAVLSVVLCLDRLKDQHQRAQGQDLDVGRCREGGGGGRRRRWLRWHDQHQSGGKSSV